MHERVEVLQDEMEKALKRVMAIEQGQVKRIEKQSNSISTDMVQGLREDFENL